MDKPLSWKIGRMQLRVSPERVDDALQRFWAGSADEIELLSASETAHPPASGTCHGIGEAIRAIQARHEGRLVAWLQSWNWLR